jgi:hypothetical protein
MSKLSSAQWANIRAAWQASPRAGFSWLTEAGGGPWPISREGVRLRAQREGWTKISVTADMVARAHRAADRAMLARGELAEFACSENPASQAPSAVAPEPSFGSLDEPDGDSDALCDWLVEVHRREWKAARRLVHAAMRQAELATGLEKARFTKLVVEALRLIQIEERASYGLDARMIDYDGLTDMQLQSLAAGRRPR